MGKCIWMLVLAIMGTQQSHAQEKTKNSRSESPVNKFMQFKNTNADSAYFYLKRIAGENSSPSFGLDFVIHNLFAQDLLVIGSKQARSELQQLQEKINLELLDKMNNSELPELKEMVRPVKAWMEVKLNITNAVLVNKRLRELGDLMTTSKDIYPARIARYALMIVNLTQDNRSASENAKKLFMMTLNKLRSSVNRVSVDTASVGTLNRRAWYRYLYAYQQTVLAGWAKQEKNEKKVIGFYKNAFDYSPDYTDRKHADGFYYEMTFILGKEKRSFREEYLDYLVEKSVDTKQTLNVLLRLSLELPELKSKLRAYFEKTKGDSTDFRLFWQQEVNKYGKKVPPFTVMGLNGTMYSDRQFRGKWVLLDFWGTWCSPCLAEHPAVEKYYLKTVLPAGEPELLMVACRDSEERVNTYLEKTKYTFPVAMSDKRVEESFKIDSYPSKILITPEGNYLIIPFGADWINYIKWYKE